MDNLYFFDLAGLSALARHFNFSSSPHFLGSFKNFSGLTAAARYAQYYTAYLSSSSVSSLA